MASGEKGYSGIGIISVVTLNAYSFFVDGCNSMSKAVASEGVKRVGDFAR